MGQPLLVLSAMMLSTLVLIEGLHTAAHLHQKLDVHGVCRQNREYIESKER